jgi:hypothetical protein
LNLVRSLNPTFDSDIRGGAALARLLGRLSAEAEQHLAAVTRAERTARSRSTPLHGVAVDELGLDLERLLQPLQPVQRGAHDVDDVDDEHSQSDGDCRAIGATHVD